MNAATRLNQRTGVESPCSGRCTYKFWHPRRARSGFGRRVFPWTIGLKTILIRTGSEHWRLGLGSKETVNLNWPSLSPPYWIELAFGSKVGIAEFASNNYTHQKNIKRYWTELCWLYVLMRFMPLNRFSLRPYPERDSHCCKGMPWVSICDIGSER